MCASNEAHQRLDKHRQAVKVVIQIGRIAARVDYWIVS
jgi:hypothetical protein